MYIFFGIVKAIRLKSKNISNVVAYYSCPGVVKYEKNAAPGMTEIVDCIISIKRNYLLIPKSTIHLIPFGMIIPAYEKSRSKYLKKMNPIEAWRNE